MTDFNYTYTGEQLQAHHNKIAATSGNLVDTFTNQVTPLGNNNIYWRTGMIQNTQGNPMPPSGNYTANSMVAFNWFAGATGATGVDVTDSGILFTGGASSSIYMEYTLGGGSNLTSDELTCHIKGDGGELFWLKNGESGVSITINAGIAKLEFSGIIFGALSIARIKEIGLQAQVGVFPDLNEVEVSSLAVGYKQTSNARGVAREYPSGKIEQEMTVVTSTAASLYDFPIPMPNTSYRCYFGQSGSGSTESKIKERSDISTTTAIALKAEVASTTVNVLVIWNP